MTKLTVGFFPRERFSIAEESLKRVLASDMSIHLVFMDCVIPEKYQSRLLPILESHTNVTIIRREQYLLPNEARNLVSENCKTEFLCWIENDVLIEPNCFSQLIAACEEQEADVAIPLIVERQRQFEWFHFDKRLGYIKQRDGMAQSRYEIVRRNFPARWDETSPRIPLQMVENHCVLLRTSTAKTILPLDRELNTREEVDLSFALYHAGAKVVMEPKCRVVFMPPPPIETEERNYFNIRWDFQQAEKSENRLIEKWNLVNLPSTLSFVQSKRRILEQQYQEKQPSEKLEELGPLEETGIQLQAVVPIGSTIILIDDQCFDDLIIAKELAPRRTVVPYLEKDEVYWGAPADSEIAIHELARMRNRGVQFFIIAWPAFWWVDCYPAFMDHLRTRFLCALESEILMIFDLRNQPTPGRYQA